MTRRRKAALWLICGLLVPACADSPTVPAARTSVPAVSATAVETVPLGTLALPRALTSVKFAVIGDSGRGTPPQHEVAAQMLRYREVFPFAFVIMVGDNIYAGPATPEDYRRKFEEPYQGLLDKGVRFYAVLGNHDDPRQVDYEPFHMRGERYYSFSPPEDLLTRIATQVELFAVDSTNLDRVQLRWLDERLGASKAAWKISFFHHPLYTSGRYRRSSLAHRLALEPILTRHHVDAVFSGHEHIYQRSELVNGIQYFISGGAGSLRVGDGTAAPYIAKTYDEDYHFMLIEVEGDAMHFQAVSRKGVTIDAGTLYKNGSEAHGTDEGVSADTPARR